MHVQPGKMETGGRMDHMPGSWAWRCIMPLHAIAPVLGFPSVATLEPWSWQLQHANA